MILWEVHWYTDQIKVNSKVIIENKEDDLDKERFVTKATKIKHTDTDTQTQTHKQNKNKQNREFIMSNQNN